MRARGPAPCRLCSARVLPWLRRQTRHRPCRGPPRAPPTSKRVNSFDTRVGWDPDNRPFTPPGSSCLAHGVPSARPSPVGQTQTDRRRAGGDPPPPVWRSEGPHGARARQRRTGTACGRRRQPFAGGRGATEMLGKEGRDSKASSRSLSYFVINLPRNPAQLSEDEFGTACR